MHSDRRSYPVMSSVHALCVLKYLTGRYYDSCYVAITENYQTLHVLGNSCFWPSIRIEQFCHVVLVSYCGYPESQIISICYTQVIIMK